MSTERRDRPFIASLAHQKAGQVAALRDAAGRIKDDMTPAQTKALLQGMANTLQRDIEQMATQMEPGNA